MVYQLPSDTSCCITHNPKGTVASCNKHAFLRTSLWIDLEVLLIWAGLGGGSLPRLWASTGQWGGFAAVGGLSLGPQQGRLSCLVSAARGLSFYSELALPCSHGALSDRLPRQQVEARRLLETWAPDWYPLTSVTSLAKGSPKCSPESEGKELNCTPLWEELREAHIRRGEELGPFLQPKNHRWEMKEIWNLNGLLSKTFGLFQGIGYYFWVLDFLLSCTDIV